MSIPINEVIRRIDASGLTNEPFKITFCKVKDGSKRDMICCKRNRVKNVDGTAKDRVPFKYQLSENHALLVNEVFFKTKKIENSGDTWHRIADHPLMSEIDPTKHRQRPITIKIYSILMFNGEKVKA